MVLVWLQHLSIGSCYGFLWQIKEFFSTRYFFPRKKSICRKQEPLDLFNKLSKRLPSNLQCNMFFPQFWLMLRALQSCHWKTSLEEKSRKQKQVKTPGKSDSHTLPPLCLYEYIVSLPIVFVTNLGKHPWCKRYFPNLCIISD